MKTKKISRLQAVFFINQTQISIGILALPHLLMMKSGSSGWISILLTGLLVQLTFSLYMILFHRFPKMNLYEMLEEVFGTFGRQRAASAVYFIFYVSLHAHSFCIYTDLGYLGAPSDSELGHLLNADTRFCLYRPSPAECYRQVQLYLNAIFTADLSAAFIHAGKS